MKCQVSNDVDPWDMLNNFCWLPCSPISSHIQGGGGGSGATNCSECQQDVRKLKRQTGRQTDRQEDIKTFQLS